MSEAVERISKDLSSIFVQRFKDIKGLQEMYTHDMLPKEVADEHPFGRVLNFDFRSKNAVGVIEKEIERVKGLPFESVKETLLGQLERIKSSLVREAVLTEELGLHVAPDELKKLIGAGSHSNGSIFDAAETAHASAIEASAARALVMRQNQLAVPFEGEIKRRLNVRLALQAEIGEVVKDTPLLKVLTPQHYNPEGAFFTEQHIDDFIKRLDMLNVNDPEFTKYAAIEDVEKLKGLAKELQGKLRDDAGYIERNVGQIGAENAARVLGKDGVEGSAFKAVRETHEAKLATLPKPKLVETPAAKPAGEIVSTQTADVPTGGSHASGAVAASEVLDSPALKQEPPKLAETPSTKLKGGQIENEGKGLVNLIKRKPFVSAAVGAGVLAAGGFALSALNKRNEAENQPKQI